MIDQFPKKVIVIIGHNNNKPENPDWINDGNVWFVKSQKELDNRIYKNRNVFANAFYSEKYDEGQEWFELVLGTTYFFCEDFDESKHFKF